MKNSFAKWEKEKLGTYLSVLTDYHANGSYKILKANVELLDKPNYAVMIRTTNFEKKDFTDDLKYITKHAYEFLKKSRVYPGDILMNKIANAGSVYFMPDLERPVSLAMNLFLIRVNNNQIDQKFLYYYLKRHEKHIKKFAIGTATTTITKDSVRNLDITHPPLPDQQKIASTLSAYDDLIENNTRRIAILEEMAQIIYREWFVKFRFPGHEKVKMVDSPLGKIPEGWEVKTLGDVIDIQWGDTSVTKKSYVEKGFAAYSASGKDGMLDYYDFNRDGIVLSAIGANCGRTWFATGKWSCIKNTIRFWGNNSCVSNEYLFYYTGKSNFWPKRGSAQPFISQGDCKNLNILISEKNILKEFTIQVSVSLKTINILNKKNNVLRQTRNLLLPKLISGELDVSDLDIEILESDEPELQASAGGIK
jgi:type I restriction enzyme, S subunit